MHKQDSTKFSWMPSLSSYTRALGDEAKRMSCLSASCSMEKLATAIRWYESTEKKEFPWFEVIPGVPVVRGDPIEAADDLKLASIRVRPAAALRLADGRSWRGCHLVPTALLT